MTRGSQGLGFLLFRGLVWRTLGTHAGLLATAVMTVALGVALGFGIRLGTESAKVGLEKNLEAFAMGGWIGPVTWDSKDSEHDAQDGALQHALAPLADFPVVLMTEVSVTALDPQDPQATLPMQLQVLWGATQGVEDKTQTEGLSRIAQILMTGTEGEPAAAGQLVILADASCRTKLQSFTALQPHLSGRSSEPMAVRWRFEDTGVRSCQTLFASAVGAGSWVPSPTSFYVQGPTEKEAAKDFEDHLAAMVAQMPGVQLKLASQELADLNKLTESMQINLQLMGLVALLIGIYMVNHVMSAVVTRQSQTFAVLNALGVGFRRQVAPMLGFVSLMGTVAAVFGALGGLAVGRLVSLYAGRSFQALYDRRLNPDLFEFRPLEFVVAVGLGLAICFLGAFVPLLRLSRLDTAEVMRTGSWHERYSKSFWQRGTVIVLVAGILTFVLLRIPIFVGRQPVSAYIACFVILLGAAGCVRPMLETLTRWSGRSFSHRRWMREFRLYFPPQTAIMVQVLVLSFGLTVGVRVMSESFRATLEQWTAATIKADVWVRHSAGAETPLDADLIAEVRKLKEDGTARAVDGLRVLRGRILLDSKSFPIAISAVSLADQSLVTPLRLVSDGDDVSASVQSALSEEMAQQGTSCKGTLQSPCPTYVSQSLVVRLKQEGQPSSPLRVEIQGTTVVFEPRGVFADFGNDSGAVLTDARMLERVLGRDLSPGFVNVYLKDPSETQVNTVMSDLGRWLSGGSASVTSGEASQGSRAVGVEVLSGPELRERIMTVFEETFAVTDALYVLSGAIACLTVLCSLGLQLLMRSQEWTVLWANGLSIATLKRRITAWAGLMTLCAYLLSAPVGMGLGAVLVYVVNYYAFGFDLTLEIPWGFLAGLIVVAVGTGVVGGALTSRRIATLCSARWLNPE